MNNILSVGETATLLGWKERTFKNKLWSSEKSNLPPAHKYGRKVISFGTRLKNGWLVSLLSMHQSVSLVAQERWLEMARIYGTRTERIKVALTKQEKLNFEKAAKQLNVSVSQLCRTLVKENKDREINETAIAINSVKEMIDKQMVEFAKANDIATSFLINNLSNLYESKLEKLQQKVNSMAPYLEEANRIIAAREAVLRKKRAQNRV